jgi:hypothetical protein
MVLESNGSGIPNQWSRKQDLILSCVCLYMCLKKKTHDMCVFLYTYTRTQQIIYVFLLIYRKANMTERSHTSDHHTHTVRMTKSCGNGVRE